MMTSKTKIKNLKPIEIDLHLKYQCPECHAVHWLSQLEAKTQGFKIVCDCSLVLIPRKIQSFKILYHKKKKILSQQPETSNTKNAIAILKNYGFSEEEADRMISVANIKITDNITTIIKKSLAHKLGELENDKCD